MQTKRSSRAHLPHEARRLPIRTFERLLREQPQHSQVDGCKHGDLQQVPPHDRPRPGPRPPNGGVTRLTLGTLCLNEADNAANFATGAVDAGFVVPIGIGVGSIIGLQLRCLGIVGFTLVLGE